MKIVVIGGTGAIGLIFGARPAHENDVVLLDVNKNAVEAVNTYGAEITNKEGNIEVIKNVRATQHADDIGIAELALVFTKCYWAKKR